VCVCVVLVSGVYDCSAWGKLFITKPTKITVGSEEWSWC